MNKSDYPGVIWSNDVELGEIPIYIPETLSAKKKKELDDYVQELIDDVSNPGKE